MYYFLKKGIYLLTYCALTLLLTSLESKANTVTFTYTIISQSTGEVHFDAPKYMYNDAQYPIKYWNWNFGDGGTSSQEDPIHFFNVCDAPYNVTLSVLFNSPFFPSNTYLTATSPVETITFDPEITAGIIGNLFPCPDKETVLTATVNGVVLSLIDPSVSYSWTPGNGSFRDKEYYISNQTITVTVFINKICGSEILSDEATVEITPSSFFNAGIIGPSTVCSGDSVTLTATINGNIITDNPSEPSYHYYWDGPSVTAVNGNQNSITILPEGVITNYSVTITNDCFTSSAPFTVETVPSFTAGFIGDTVVCQGNYTQLIATIDGYETAASSETTYFWSPGGETTNSIYVHPDSSTIYSVSITLNGCTKTFSDTVFVSEINISGGPWLCDGYNTTLSVEVTDGFGGWNSSLPTIVNYHWSTGDTTASISLNPALPNPTEYCVTVVLNNGCISKDCISLLPHESPTALINGPSEIICPGQNFFLSVDGENNYLWSTGDTIQWTMINPTTTTSYSVTVYNDAGCYDTANFTVNVLAISIQGDSVVCPGNSTTLTALINGQSTASLDYSYSWSTGEMGFSSITVTPNSNQTYSVTVYYSGLCLDTANINVIVNDFTAGISGNTNICAGNSSTLSATIDGIISTDPAYSYSWSNGLTTRDVLISPSVSTIYSVTVTDNYGCTGSSQVSITLPTASISAVATEICSGQNITLIANGGITYSWYPGNQTTSVINIFPTASTNYIVTVTDVNGCTNSTDVGIIVNAVPSISISGVTNICSGTPSTLTASGGVSYLWSPGGETSPTISVLQNTTTYSVTVTDANGCTAVSQRTVTVNPSPNIIISGGPFTVCAGSQVTLNASGAGSYLWSNTKNSATIIEYPTVTTTYSVTGTDANGCTASNSVTVNADEVPVASIIMTGDPCLGSVTLTGNGTGNYLWSSGETSPSITVSPTVTTTYTLTVNNNGCTSQASVTITLPTASVSATSSTICAGESVTLTATGGQSYQWSNGTSGNVTTVNPVQTTTYQVTVTDGNGCTDNADLTIIVNPSPQPSITGPSAICYGESASLSVNGGTTYNWSVSGNTNSQITVTPLASTAYSVTVTDVNGCQSSATKTVTVNQIPVVTVTANPANICEGEQSILTASGAGSYSWSGGPSSGNYTVTPTVTTTYTVTGTDGSGCSATGNISVNVTPIPVAGISISGNICAGAVTLIGSGTGEYLWSTGGTMNSITVQPNVTTTYTLTVTDNGCSNEVSLTINLPVATITTSASSVCTGESVTLQASGGINYQWSTGAVLNNISVQPMTQPTTTYQVTVTDANGCTDVAEVVINVNPTPVISISGNTTICSGQSTTLTATGGTVYAWTGGETANTLTVSPLTTTNYGVTVTNAGNCQSTAEATVTVGQTPTVSVVASKTTICEGETVTLTASGAQAYSWTGGYSGYSIQVSPTVTTTYTVTGLMADGCSGTAIVTINVVPLPSAGITIQGDPCSGNPVTLLGSGTGSYLWSTGETAPTISVQPTISTSYSLTVTEGNCSDNTDISFSYPVAIITASSTSVCEGESVTLTANGGSNYMWSTGDNFNSITITPLAPQALYSVTVYDVNGCSDQQQILINVNPLPVISFTGSTNICAGTTTTITAVGGNNYLWVPGGQTDSYITVQPIINTTYSLIVTDANGCSNESDVNVNVNQTPAGSISGLTTICEGESTTLTAIGGAMYLWSTSETNSQITVSPTENTNYTVEISNGSCTETLSVSITVNDKPIAQITGDNLICQGESTTLVASGGNAYSWSSGELVNSINVSPLVNTDYSVTVGNGTGCIDVANFTVEVTNAEILGSTTICEGESTTLSAFGGDAYLWSDGSTGQSIIVSPLVSQNYSITVFNSIGNCTDSESLTVNVNPSPTAQITGSSNIICLGNSVTLIASGGSSYLWSTGETSPQIIISPITTQEISVIVSNNSGCVDTASYLINVTNNLEATISGPSEICPGTTALLTASGGSTYSWSTGEIINQISVSPVNSSTYSVTVGDGSGCVDIESFTLNVPNASITGVNAICFGESTTLTASNGISFIWNDVDVQTSQSISVTPLTNTTYSVTVTDANSCQLTAFKNITVNNPPASGINGSTNICEGGSLTLTAMGTGNYSWSNSEITQSITVSPIAGNYSYSVTVTSIEGCQSISYTSFTVYSKPTVAISGNFNICLGNQTTLNASGTGTLTWTNGNTSSSINVNPTQNSVYSVTITDANGCTNSTSASVNVSPLPTVSISGPSSVCSGQTITLTGNGSGSYSWANGEITNSINVTPVTNTNYKLFITSINGCSNYADHYVTVLNAPSANITGTTIICSGTNSTLTASGGVSYLWSPGGETLPTITTLQSTTTYSVTVTDANGCTAVSQRTVTVNPSPNVIISGGSFSVCAGSQVTLNASGAGTYLWSNTKNTATIIEYPTVTTTYSVTGTDANGCTASNSVTVNADEVPVAEIILTGDPCLGSVTLTGNGTGNYLWSTGETLPSITVSPTVTTTYTLTVNYNGCTSQSSVTITLPTAAVSATSSTNCAGESVTLTATGGQSYQWSNGTSGNVSTVNPVQTTTYQVTVTDGNGCTDNADITIIVNPAPQPSITSPSAICYGESATLSVNGGTTYNWSVSGNTNSQITVTPLASTAYSVTVTDVNGCQSSATKTVTVNSIPVITVTANPANICEGEQSILTASGAGSYSWSGGPSGGNYTVAPSVTTTYTVTGTDGNGCSANGNISVNVTPIPVAGISISGNICAGAVTLIGSGTGEYLWSTGGTMNSITVQPNVTTTYTLTVTDNGCSAEASLTINLPVATITTSAVSVCAGESVTLQASGGINYQWSTGAVLNNISVQPMTLPTTTYQVTVTDANGCTDVAEVVINVNPATVISISGNTTICSGQSTTLTATGGTVYTWTGGGTANTLTVSPLTTTNYGVTVTNAENCQSTASATVTVGQTPTVSVVASKTTICEGETVTLTASGAQTYSWTGGYSGYSIQVSPTATTTYTVTGLMADGCSGTAIVTINVVPLPSAGITIQGDPCSGNPVTLLGSGTGSYSWSTGGTTTSILVQPTITTTYTLTVTNGNNCTDVANVTITLPNASISSTDNSICMGGSTTLQASGGTSYIWSSGATGSSINVSPSLTQTYFVVVYNGSGCSDQAQIEITVNDNPSITFNSLSPVCENSSPILLNAQPNGGNFSGTGVVNGNQFDPAIAGTGNHIISYTYTDINGCSSTQSQTISVYSSPTLYINPISPLCENSSAVTISATPTGGIFSGTGVINNDQFDPSLAGVGTHVISYYYSDINGCSSTVSENIIVNPLPTATIDYVDPLCATAPSVILIGTPSGGTFSGNGVTGNIFDPADAMIGNNFITYSYTDGNGCSIQSGIFIKVNSIPVVSIDPLSPICVDAGIIQLSANPTGGIFNGPGISGDTFDPSLTGAGTFTISYTYTSSFGCTNTSTQTIVVNNLPTITFEPVSPTAPLCENSSIVTLVATPVGGAFSGNGVMNGNQFDPSVAGSGTHAITYTFTDDNGCTNSANQYVVVGMVTAVSINSIQPVCVYSAVITLTGVPAGGAFSGNGVSGNIFTPSAQIVGNNVITYTYVNGDGCISSASTIAVVYPLPVVTISTVSPLCANANPVVLNGSPVGGTFVGMGVSGNIFNPLNALVGANIITYNYTDLNGCSNFDNQSIIVYGIPSVDFSVVTPICINSSVITMVATPTGGVFTGNGVVNGNQFDPFVSGIGQHTITYTYTDANGCSNSATQVISVNELPVVTIDPVNPICINENEITLNGSPSGGIFSGTGVSNGVFYPSIAGVGVHSITYSYTNVNGCTNTAAINITVNGLPSVTMDPISDVCIDGSDVTLIANPTGGIFTGAGVTGNIFSPLNAGLGTHTITYIYADANGCTNFTFQIANVYPKPIVAIGMIDPLCLNAQPVQLYGKPLGGIFSGVGVNGNFFDPTVAGPGANTITYTYTDIHGCTGYASFTVTVFPLPSVSINPVPVLCETDSPVTLSGYPSGGIFSGNGVSGNTFDPSVTGAGNFVVYYTWTDQNGCSNTAKTIIIVNKNHCEVNPDFNYTNGNCGTVTFYDKSITECNTGITNWFWSFGDGTTSTAQDPSHIYAVQGTYYVCLNVYASNGSMVCKNSICKKIDVKFEDVCEMDAKFTFKYGKCGTIYFTDLSSVTCHTTISSWYWEFGDGTASNLQNPSHVYNNPGNYIVCLTIFGDNGIVKCKDRICVTIKTDYKQTPCALYPGFNYTNNNNLYWFKDASFAGTGTTITGWFWSFGNGYTSTLQNPSHTYLKPGYYKVCLTIYGENCGQKCSKQICYTIFVKGPIYNCIVTANFNFKGIGYTKQFAEVSFLSAGTTITGWYWNFGDGTSSTNQNPIHTFPANGIYNVCLTVYAVNGNQVCKNTVCRKVYVYGKSNYCGSEADLKYSHKDKMTVDFMDESMVSENRKIISYEWDFGDGTKSNAKNNEHTYQHEGKYEVCLTITSTNGIDVCSDKICQTIEISLSSEMLRETSESASIDMGQKMDSVQFFIYPNPAQEKISINYDVPAIGEIWLEIFDNKGTRVDAYIIDPVQKNKEILIYGLNEGLYFVKLFVNNSQMAVRKVIVIR